MQANSLSSPVERQGLLGFEDVGGCSDYLFVHSVLGEIAVSKGRGLATQKSRTA